MERNCRHSQHGWCVDCVREAVAEKQKLITFACNDWADTDTRVKEICAKHGIPTEHPANCNYFKSLEECVEELSAKLTAAEADIEQSEKGA
jgi:hypothetical protein